MHPYLRVLFLGKELLFASSEYVFLQKGMTKVDILQHYLYVFVTQGNSLFDLRFNNNIPLSAYFLSSLGIINFLVAIHQAIELVVPYFFL